MRAKWRKMKLPTMAEKNAEKVWKTMAWATYNVMIDSEMADWWRNRSVWGIRVDSICVNVETPVGLS